MHDPELKSVVRSGLELDTLILDVGFLDGNLPVMADIYSQRFYKNDLFTTLRPTVFSIKTFFL